MTEHKNILVVDDEPKMRNLVKLYLEKEGYRVTEASDGEEALDIMNRLSFDLIILDIMMPKVDGLTVCKELRKKQDTPVIMLTARGEEIDRVIGFELGADDYVVKPFSPRELAARVKAMLRRIGARANPQKENVINFPGLDIRLEAREVVVEGNKVALTPKEFELLLFMARNPGRVFTREQLLEHVWGYDFFGDLRTVDTHIKKLREKISKASNDVSYIVTVWGVGYKFEVAK